MTKTYVGYQLVTRDLTCPPSEVVKECNKLNIGSHFDNKPVVVCDERFNLRNTAYSALKMQHKPGNAMMAMSYVQTVQTNPQKDKVLKKLAKVNTDLSNLRRAIMEAARSGKSARVTCQRCKSQLTRSVIQSHECPLCHEPLAKGARHARHEKLFHESHELDKEYQKASDETRAKKIVSWVVGGWVSDDLGSDREDEVDEQEAGITEEDGTSTGSEGASEEEHEDHEHEA